MDPSRQEPRTAHPGGNAETRIAVIDLGSNTALMSVLFGHPSEPRRLRIAEELQIITGLGRDRGEDGSLNPAARARVLSALSHFAGRLDAMAVPPSAVLGATTAAMREASDGGHVLLHKPVMPELLLNTVARVLLQRDNLALSG